ncbi:MAG: formylglycine-generating enzyme family protein, partial [Symploca sp. SIO2G7]|nr:formylglycine-generating enzyme family protein [Symploca sp. SIO2G7]
MPRPPQLPESLRLLARRNAIEVGNNPRFHTDMNRLVKELKKILGEAVAASEHQKSEEKVISLQPRPKYDLRGAQFGSGFAETVTGDQVGGIINNGPAELPGADHQSPALIVVEKLGNGVTLEMVCVPEGDFLMGAPKSEAEHANSSEGPQHRVQVSAFYMGKFPVTQAQWEAVTKLKKIEIDLQSEPSYFKGDNLPVEQVSWFEAVEFCQRLSRYTGKSYRLPSEAEWEYACRAGTTTPFCFGESISTEQANYDGNYTYGNGKKGKYRKKTTPVGNLSANSFGLYDMHGNVWEWCQD